MPNQMLCIVIPVIKLIVISFYPDFNADGAPTREELCITLTHFGVLLSAAHCTECWILFQRKK